jgi:hypothetical protein
MPTYESTCSTLEKHWAKYCRANPLYWFASLTHTRITSLHTTQVISDFRLIHQNMTMVAGLDASLHGCWSRIALQEECFHSGGPSLVSDLHCGMIDWRCPGPRRCFISWSIGCAADPVKTRTPSIPYVPKSLSPREC